MSHETTWLRVLSGWHARSLRNANQTHHPTAASPPSWSATRALPHGAAANVQTARRLTHESFSEKLVAPFPRGGSIATPVHRASSDFEWRDYCPAVFR